MVIEQWWERAHRKSRQVPRTWLQEPRMSPLARVHTSLLELHKSPLAWVHMLLLETRMSPLAWMHMSLLAGEHMSQLGEPNT